jgi:hypothetical protein
MELEASLLSKTTRPMKRGANNDRGKGGRIARKKGVEPCEAS